MRVFGEKAILELIFRIQLGAIQPDTRKSHMKCTARVDVLLLNTPKLVRMITQEMVLTVKIPVRSLIYANKLGYQATAQREFNLI